MKKLICFMAACAIFGSMLTPVSVSAEGGSYISGERRLSISGESDSDFVTIVITPYETDITTINADTINSNKNILYKAVKTNNGKYSAGFLLSENLEYGRYIVHIFEDSAERRFELIKPGTDTAEVIKSLDGMALENMYGTVSANKQKLGLESDFFADTYRGAVSGMANKIRNLSADEILSMYAVYEGVERIKNKSITADEYFEKYTLYLGDEIIDGYNALSEAARSELTDVFSALPPEDKSHTDYFNEVFWIGRVKSAQNYKELQQTVLDYFEEINISTADYDKLSSSKKEDVFLKLREDIGNITSCELLKTAFNRRVSEAAKKSSGQNGSGGGDGGGKAAMSSMPSVSNTGKDASSSVQTGGTGDGFSDIDGHWANESIISLAQRSIISGYEDRSFRPENSVTRAEFATMVTKAMNISYGSGNQFADVTESDWFYSAVYGAAQAGIVRGVDDTHFEPMGSITRQDAAVILYRASGSTGAGAEMKFSDKDVVADYAKDAVAVLSAGDVIKGSAGRFEPLNMITRAEAAAMIYRIITMPAGIAQINTYDDYEKSKKLTEALTGEELLSTLGEEEIVSRAEFIELLIKAMKKPITTETEHVFSDVEKDSEAGQYIYTALNYGWLDKTANANPDEDITMNEALKYAVCAADAQKLAEFRGGYPMGYFSVADEAEFMEGLHSTDAFTKEAALMLLYNILNAGIIEFDITGSNGYRFVQSNELYMTRLYDAYVEEGIIRQTSFNSLDYTAGVEEQNFIVVGDTRVSYDDVTDDILGYNAEVYYIDDEIGTRAVLVNLTDNSVLTIDLKDASVEGRTVSYSDNIRSRNFRIASECFYVYNGRTEKSFSDELFGSSDGKMTFVDNNEDGIYDIAYANVYEYVVVNTVDREGKLISDINDNKLIVDLNRVVRDDNIYGADGKKQTLYNIGKNTVLEVKRSHDAQIVNIRIAESSLNGAISSIRYEDNIAVVNGQEYGLTDYFVKWYTDDVLLGVDTSMVVSSDGRIIYFGDNAGTELYAYAIKALLYEDGTSGIKLLTEKNNIVKYDFADRVTVDDAKLESDAAQFRTLITASESQLIRYKLNGEGRVVMIDTAKLYDGVSEIGAAYTGNDCLTQFVYEKNTMRYRSNAQTFSPYFNVSKSIVFKIPTGKTEEEYYEAGMHNMFINGNDYTLTVYDVDKYGNAGAVVLNYDVDNQLFATSDVSYVIEKVEKGIHDDEIADIVTCWSQGKYFTFYIEEDTTVKKASGAKLEAGDIARFKFREDKIISVCVDYYLDNGTVVANSGYSAAVFNKSDQQIGYVDGVAKDVSEQYASVTNTKISSTEYDTSFGALKNYSINTSYIVRYDREEETLRPVSADEIKTYSVYGADADYLVLRQNYDNTQLVVLYN